MVDVTILVNETEIKRRLGKLAYKSGSVISRAANRAATTGKVAISKETAKKYDISKSDLNSPRVFTLKKATRGNPTARLTYSGNHRNLFLWNNKRAVTPGVQIHWTHGNPNVKHYKARVMKGHRRTPLTGSNAPFIQKTKNNGFVGLFRRKTESTYSRLVGVAAPAVPQIVKNEETLALFTQNAGEMFQKRLEHEISRALEGH